jgi:microcystin degradation protein MlrC
MGWLSQLREKYTAAQSAGINPEASFTVAVTDEGVSCSRPTGLIESVAWDDLKEVSIITNDEGPFAIDVMWLLVGDHGGCVVPQGAAGEGELLKRLQGLDGFNSEAVVEAMSSTTNRKFLCWQKQ